MNLVDRIIAIADALETSSIEWAFGGAFALAYATEEPRGTRDIDEMTTSGTLDRGVASRRLASVLGEGDPRITRLAGHL